MFPRTFIHVKQSTFSRLALLKDRFQIPDKWKGGRIEKWSLFWQGLLLDYKSVATDVIQGAKTKPYKALFVTTGLGAAFTAIKTNPDEHSFYDSLIYCATTLSLVGDSIRNPESEQHIEHLTRYRNQGLLRRADLIFLTLVWVADYSKDCDIFAAQCKYLQPRYITFYERIIDVGVFGSWWNMKLKMRNFDINPKEWIRDQKSGKESIA